MAVSSLVVARSPLHHWHTAHGARFAESGSWQVPATFSDPEREAAAARSGIGLADLSAFAKISVQGQGAANLTRAIAPDSPGRKLLGVATLQLRGPVLACRLTAEHLLLLASTTDGKGFAEALNELEPGAALVQTDVTSAYAGFGLVGPRAEDVLRQLTPLDVSASAFPEGSCAETSLAEVRALLLRTPGPSLPSVRIYVAWDLGEYVWERLVDVGRRWALQPLGLEGWRLYLSQPR
jgi:sarcosine oxidase subunit alpha